MNMMRYRIFYTLPDGSEDSFVILAETKSEIGELAEKRISERGGTNPWSEKLEDWELLIT